MSHCCQPAATEAPTAAGVVSLVIARTNVYFGFIVWLLLLIVVGGVVLTGDWPSRLSGLPLGVFPLLAAALVGLIAVYATNVRPVQADMVSDTSSSSANSGQWDTALPLLDQAVALAPKAENYRQSYGRTLLQAANDESDPANRDALWQRALQQLQISQRLDPLDPVNVANLARYWQERAASSGSDAQKQAWLDRSENLWSHALALAPYNVLLWNEWAQGEMVRGDATAALDKLQNSLKVDSQYNATYAQLGDYWQGLAGNQADSTKQKADLANAVESYQRAIAVEKNSTVDPPSLTARVGLGRAQMTSQNWDAAIAAFTDARALAATPQNPQWSTTYSLAEAYASKGDNANARKAAQQALALADAADKDTVQALINKLDS